MKKDLVEICKEDGKQIVNFKGKNYCGILVGKESVLCKYADSPYIENNCEYICCKKGDNNGRK